MIVTDVGRLEIAVDDSLLVGVLDSLADWYERRGFRICPDCSWAIR